MKNYLMACSIGAAMVVSMVGLPFLLYREWRFNSGYPLPGVPVRVGLRVQGFDARVVEENASGKAVLYLSVPPLH